MRDIINPDSAVEVLEMISSELQSMDKENKKFFQ
jgi:hypothetical protein